MEFAIGLGGFVITLIALIASVYFYIKGDQALKRINEVLDGYSTALRDASQSRTLRGCVLAVLERASLEGQTATVGQVDEAAGFMGYTSSDVLATLSDLRIEGVVSYDGQPVVGSTQLRLSAPPVGGLLHGGQPGTAVESRRRWRCRRAVRRNSE